MSVLDRFQKLLALAAESPEREEARTAASLACRLVREHSLTVSLPTAPGTVRTPAAAPAKPKPPDPDVVRGRAKRDGVCPTCGQDYVIGDKVLYWRGDGASSRRGLMVHQECGFNVGVWPPRRTGT